MLLWAFTTSAQIFEVPDYKIESKEDYAKYDDDIIKATDWLQQTEWTKEVVIQSNATKFIFDWIEGSPAVTVSISKPLMDLTDKNPKLLMTFMSFYVKYSLQHKAEPDNNKANIYAIKALISKYKTEPTHKKDSDVEKLLKLDAENKLDAWVTTDFVKS
ncbi:hypothetical protein GCM10023149_42970 [Mucilaginibacter gynuensis]|uniref:Uncharacterized protein n=2 Tax=Mucilaginibacter gynuensis TaxID=1302236 RepID=A0ABP8H6N4_9SPHI